jgi:hypothetical protein
MWHRKWRRRMAKSKISVMKEMKTAANGENGEIIESEESISVAINGVKWQPGEIMALTKIWRKLK